MALDKVGRALNDRSYQYFALLKWDRTQMSQATLHTWRFAPPIDKVYHKVSKLPQHRASDMIRYEVNSARWSLKINEQPTFSKRLFIILWKLGFFVIISHSIHSVFTFHLIFLSHCNCSLFNALLYKFTFVWVLPFAGTTNTTITYLQQFRQRRAWLSHW
jgi:hypothetical protein